MSTPSQVKSDNLGVPKPGELCKAAAQGKVELVKSLLARKADARNDRGIMGSFFHHCGDLHVVPKSASLFTTKGTGFQFAFQNCC